jgi:hypothetical protein
VPQIGLGVVVHEAERDQQRPLQPVSLSYGVLEGVVAFGALRLLHPVEDVRAVSHTFGVEVAQAFGLNPGLGHSLA